MGFLSLFGYVFLMEGFFIPLFLEFDPSGFRSYCAHILTVRISLVELTGGIDFLPAFKNEKSFVSIR